MIGAASCGGYEGESDVLPTQRVEEGGYLRPHHWQFTLSYRKLNSHRHFSGPNEQTQRQEQATEVRNDINLFNFILSYQASPRWSFSVNVPLLFAERKIPGKIFEEFLHQPGAPDQYQYSRGPGDVTLSAQAWIWRPPTESNGNIAVSFGLQFPTGQANAQSTVNTVNGPMRVINDQSIQPGSGGWGIVVGTQMFKAVKKAVFFADGSYVIMPQQTNGVKNGFGSFHVPANVALMSIADSYLAEAGVAYPVPKVRGLAVTFGPRYEGVPARDLIGGSEGFRRPGYAVSLGPGFEYFRGRNIWTFSMPWAIMRNRTQSVPDIENHTRGDAAFADWLILADYSVRF